MAVTFRANVSGYETARVTVNPNTTNIEDAEGVENAEDYSGTTMVDDEKKPQAEVVKPEGETSESESASDETEAAETEADVTESENASENGEAEETTGAEEAVETETSAAVETEAETEPETEAEAPAADEAEEGIELTPEEGSASASISAKKVFRVSTSAEAAGEALAADAEEETEAETETEAEEPEKETEAPVETTAEETVADDSTEETIADETQADETTAADETDGELTEETETPTEDVTAPDETTGEQPAGNGGSENIGFDNDEQFLEDDSIELAGELNGKAYNTVTIWGSANARAYVVKAEDLTGEAAVEGQYSVDYSVDPVGAATIKGAHTVNEGETLYFAVDPQVGYEITEVTANGEPLEEVDAADVASASDLEQHEHVYAVEAVTEDLEIVASLEETAPHPGFEESVTVNGVTITATAEEGILPEGTTLSVEEVTEQVQAAVKEKVEGENEGTTVTDVIAYDINLMLDGKKLNNTWGEDHYVTVNFSGNRIEEASKEADQVQVAALETSEKEIVEAAFGGTEEVSVIDNVTADDLSLEVQKVDAQDAVDVSGDASISELSVEARHFTVYTVTFTSSYYGDKKIKVKTYNVDTDKEFSVDGLSLSDISVRSGEWKEIRNFAHTIPGYTFVKATVDKRQNSNEITYLRMWYGEINYYTSNGQTKFINGGSTIYFWYKPTATQITLKAGNMGGTGADYNLAIQDGKATLPDVSATGISNTEGRDFLGWATSPDERNNLFLPKSEHSITNGAVLYAIWSYQVTFDPNTSLHGSGTKVKVNVPKTGKISTVVLPSDFSNSKNWMFVGWSGTASGHNSGEKILEQTYIPGVEFPGLAEEYITKDITLYAVWLNSTAKDGQKAEFYVRLDGKRPFEPTSYGAASYTERDTTNMVGTLRQQREINNNPAWVKANILTEPSPASIKAALKAKNIDFDPATQEIEWYVIKQQAEWHVDGVIKDKQKYWLYYDPNGGTNPPVASQYAANETVSVELQKIPSRAGYEFLGWADTKAQADAGTIVYGNGYKTSLTMPAHNRTVYAVWKANDDVMYYVEHYLQEVGTTGNLVADDFYQYGTRIVRYGVTDSTVTDAQNVLDTIPNGYRYAEGLIDNVTEGRVVPNGAEGYPLVLRLYYVIDSSQTKNLKATVDYVLGSNVQSKDHKDLTATVQVLEPSTLSTAGVEEKSYIGWKLKEIQINGKKVDELPATVSDKSAIVYYYEVDAEQTKDLKATVDYVLGSTVQNKDHKDLTATVQILKPSTLSTAEVEEKSYTGWKLKEIQINGKKVDELPATVNDKSAIVYYYEVDAEQTKDLKASVDYVLGSTVQDKDHKDLTATVQVLEPSTLSTTEVEEKSYTGWKLKEIQINGKKVDELPATVNDKSAIVYYYEVDAEQTKNLKATVDYVLGSTVQDKDHKDLTATVQVLESSILSTAGVEEKSYTGWKLKEIQINGKKVDELPATVSDKSAIVYYYEIDDEQTKNLKATVDYVLGSTVQDKDHKDLTATVQVLEPSTLSTAGVEEKSYTGWKLKEIQVNGKKVDELPATVSDKSAIVYYYEVDAEQTKNLKATVDYVLGSTVQDKDHKDLTATVQVLEPSTLSTAGVEEKSYTGWKLKKIQVNGKKVDELPVTVNDKSAIVYYYEVDAEQTKNLKATVDYVLGSTVQDKDHKDLTATVQVLEPSTLSTAGVEEKSYTGWKLKEIQINGKKVDELPATVSDKSAIVYYYEVDGGQTKNLKATVDYVLGSTVQDKDHKDLTATVQVLESSILSTAGVEEKSYTGWKLKEIQINGKKVDELPATVSDKSAIVYYYEIDDEQTKNLKATVDYVLGSTVQDKDHKDLTATVQVLEPSTLSTAGVEEKSYTGWKLKEIQVNGTIVEKLPATVSDKSAIVYYYEVDDKQTKDLKATVDYVLGSTVQDKDHKDLTAKVQVLKPSTLSTAGVEAKSYAGWKLKEIQVNGTIVEKLPATVSDKSAIVYYYEVDDKQTKDLKATVDYVLGSTVQDKDHKDLTAKVQVLQPSTLSTAGVEEKSYTGWKLKEIQVNGTIVEKLPATVSDKSAIVYYYEVDDKQTKDLKATVDYVLGSTVQDKDHKDLTAKVQVLKPSTLSTAGVEAKSYVGWNLKEIVINGTKINELPSTVEDGTVIVYYYEASTTTRYTVEAYYEHEGKYSSVPSKTETLTGTTDTQATVKAETYLPTSGYVFDQNAANVLSGTIAGDNSLVLKVYYKQVFKVTYAPGDHGSFKSQTYTVSYGSQTPGFSGDKTANGNYRFTGWDKTIESRVTGDIVYTAQWAANSNGGGGNGGGGGGSSSGGGGGSSSGPRDNGSTPSGGPGATTVTIDPDAVPLANLPNEDGAADLLVIDDEDVPLAALPKTGQSGASGLVLFLSSMMLAAFVAVSKKREDDK